MADKNEKTNENAQAQEPQTVTVEMSADEFRSIMARLESSNAGQEKYAKKQYFMSLISALASVGALLVVVFVAYQFMNLLPVVNGLLADMQVSVGNIETITTDLAKVEFSAVIEDVDSLVATSEVSIGEAMGKLNSIDFEGLNKAITDLQNIVRPLASLFGR